MTAVFELILLIAVILLYTLLGVRIGSRILSYRSAWLDAPCMPNRIVKFILCLIVGWTVASFYLAWMLIKWCIGIMAK